VRKTEQAQKNKHHILTKLFEVGMDTKEVVNVKEEPSVSLFPVASADEVATLNVAGTIMVMFTSVYVFGLPSEFAWLNAS
jgi:hypothetical protein